MNRIAVVILTVLILFSLVPQYATSQLVQPPREDTLIVSDAWGPPQGWNPLLPNPAWGYELMYPTLYFYSTLRDTWIPYLAKDYSWVDEYTIDIHLRPEAKWWDGTPITAEDVEFTFQLGKEYTISWVTPYWDYIESVKAISKDTVRIKLKKDKLNYFALFDALHGVLILPKHRWEKLKAQYGDKLASDFKDDDPSQIIGGGPYRLYMWSEDVWYYERVDDWWGKEIFGLPTPKYIAHRVFKDNVAAALAFEKGEVDGCGHFFAKIWEMWTVKGLARRTYLANPPYYLHNSIILLYIRWKYPLNDTNVRRAIAYAIPYDDLVSKAYFNYSIRASPSMIMHEYPAYAQWINETLVKKYGYEFNLEKAKQILDEAGIVDTDGDGIREMPDGTKLGPYTIQVPYGWTDWMMMCDIIATNLREIGIDITTEFPDFSVWWDRIINGEFDFIIGWDAGIGYAHPWNTFRFVMDPRLTPPAGNWEGYDNEEVIPLIDAAAKETDPIKLMRIYSKLQEIALRDLPGIPLFYGAAWYEYSEDYWVGWPAEERPEVWVSPYIWNWPDNLPWLFCLAKKGETPRVPNWITALQFPTSKFYEDLSKVKQEAKARTLLETLNQTVNDLTSRMTELERTISEVSSDVSSLKSTVSSIQSAVNKLSGIGGEVEGLKSTVNTLRTVVIVETIVLVILIVIVFTRRPKQT